ncbi:MAG: hydrogenase iron-sulfur subunit [candidate division Zixibacteria bacterium]|nr:hydrogenase iron-sulfur subunit [candidate division Zixibacteria bacterium]
MQKEFEPKIVGFLCTWCSYTGADMAGTSRMKYPPNILIVRVMCSGRVDPTFVLKAFREGADGVLIAGCHPGDCHYINGNMKTMRRYPLLVKLLESFGIENKRIRLEWVSAAEGEKFSNVVKDFTSVVKKLGPLNWKAIENQIKPAEIMVEKEKPFPGVEEVRI